MLSLVFAWALRRSSDESWSLGGLVLFVVVWPMSPGTWLLWPGWKPLALGSKKTVSPGTWPGGAGFCGGQRPSFLVLLLCFDSEWSAILITRNVASHVSLAKRVPPQFNGFVEVLLSMVILFDRITQIEHQPKRRQHGSFYFSKWCNRREHAGSPEPWKHKKDDIDRFPQHTGQQISLEWAGTHRPMVLYSPNLWEPKSRGVYLGPKGKELCDKFHNLLVAFITEKIDGPDRETLKLGLGQIETSPFHSNELGQLRNTWVGLILFGRPAFFPVPMFLLQALKSKNILMFLMLKHLHGVVVSKKVFLQEICSKLVPRKEGIQHEDGRCNMINWLGNKPLKVHLWLSFKQVMTSFPAIENFFICDQLSILWTLVSMEPMSRAKIFASKLFVVVLWLLFVLVWCWKSLLFLLKLRSQEGFWQSSRLVWNNFPAKSQIVRLYCFVLQPTVKVSFDPTIYGNHPP